MTSAHRTRVWPRPVARPHRPWLLASPIIAGVSENCCRITYRRLVGHHPSNVGVPRMRSNALWSGGAETTVSCGATLFVVCRFNGRFSFSSRSIAVSVRLFQHTLRLQHASRRTLPPAGPSPASAAGKRLSALPAVLAGWPALRANERHKTHPAEGLLTPRGLPLAGHPEELLPPLVGTHGDHQAA